MVIVDDHGNTRPSCGRHKRRGQQSEISIAQQNLCRPDYDWRAQFLCRSDRRIEHVGELEARIEVKNGIIRSVNLMGDFLLVGDLDNGLLRKVRGVPLEHAALRRVLPDHIDDIVMNLMTEDFVQLIVDS
jgi:hypothetical protein